MNWTASKVQTWVSLSSTSGTLAAGASTTVTVSINSGANALAPGAYTDMVSFNNTANNNGNTTRPVSLTVNPPVATPEIILDNPPAGGKSEGQTFTGTWCNSSAAGYYGTGSLYSCGSATDTYRWTPTIPTAGFYDVYVWWTSDSNRSTNVPIAVTHTGGTSTRTYNQQTGGGTWVLHGNYSFNAGAEGSVQVSAINGEACADAVRFVLAASTGNRLYLPLISR